MNNYKKAGVDIAAGDLASKLAYKNASRTFSSRRGLIGQAIIAEGDFAGLIDMNDFYLVQCDDGIGTKMQIAEKIDKFNTLGYDLLAMVADDAVCLGAETISISNTIDTNKIDTKIINEMMQGLAEACIEQKVIIPGGEIAELGNSLNGNIWNATALGILEKDKILTGKEIQVGDKIISLKENGFRSNGFSLVRYILEHNFGKNVYTKMSPFGKVWGEMLLEPSRVYSSEVLNILGRFGEKRKIRIKGICHITGGGVANNFKRILKNKGLGAYFYDLFSPAEMIIEIQKIGNISEREAYKTWNMGNGMMLVVAPQDVEKTLDKFQTAAKLVGEITNDDRINIRSCGADPQNIIFKF